MAIRAVPMPNHNKDCTPSGTLTKTNGSAYSTRVNKPGTAVGANESCFGAANCPVVRHPFHKGRAIPSCPWIVLQGGEHLTFCRFDGTLALQQDNKKE